MAPCPYMVKTFKIFFSGTGGPISMNLGMYHWGLLPIIVCWSDLDLFYGNVKFANICFSIGKWEKVDISESIAASGLKISRCRQLIQ